MTTATAPKKPADTAREFRSLGATELRAAGEGEGRTISGYAVVYNSPSEEFPGEWVEVFKPGAFTRCLAGNPDIVCVFDHEGGLSMMGRTRSGTLNLREDEKGVHFECKPPDTQAARDLLTLIERKDIAGCSFRFSVNRKGPQGDRWIFSDKGPDIREVFDADLFEVGPVIDPAYRATSVSARSREGAESLAAAAKERDGARAAAGAPAMRGAWLECERLAGAG